VFIPFSIPFLLINLIIQLFHFLHSMIHARIIFSFIHSAGCGEDLFHFIEILQSEEFLVPAGSDCFSLRLVTYPEVLLGLVLLRSVTLTGPEHIASTLTNKINSFYKTMSLSRNMENGLHNMYQFLKWITPKAMMIFNQLLCCLFCQSYMKGLCTTRLSSQWKLTTF